MTKHLLEPFCHAMKFNFGDRVTIDDDKSIVATVVGLLLRPRDYQIEISWFANGAHHSAWFDEYRLKKVDE